MTSAPLLDVQGLKKFFPMGGGRYVAAVNDVTFTLERGETLGLVGESGSGKTTVARCVIRLIDPTAGRVLFEGVDIAAVKESDLRRLRPRMQLVFQDYFLSLNPRWTAGRLIEEPLVLQHELNAIARSSRVSDVVESVGLTRRHLDRLPYQLTASEQQRVGIARSLATRPGLVVLDEPTSNLDPFIRAEIIDLLLDLQSHYGMSYLLISHDLTAVAKLSHRIAIMYLGHLVEIAQTQTILRKQLHPYSRALLSAVLYPDPSQPPESLSLQGEIPSAINPPDECPLVSRCPFVVDQCRTKNPPLIEVEKDHFSACYRSSEFTSAGVPVIRNDVSTPSLAK
jgi:oligopeptide/dipeptide ABC transporter ATP-binding protein